jgi:membrane protein
MSTIGGVVTLARDRNLTFMAAGIAYYAFVSIIPLLLLAVVVASVVGGQELASRVTEMLSQQLSSSGRELVTQALTNSAGRGAASVVGLVTLTWTGLKLFRGLDQAFDEVYTYEVDASLLERVKDALVVVVGIALAVGLVAVGAALPILDFQIPFVDVVGSLVLVAVLTVALLPIYYVLPPVDVSVGEVLPGAVLAAIGWVILQVGFRIYAANAGRFAAYGIIGAVLLFVTWLYFAGIVVLLGAAVNAVRRGVRTEAP